MKREPDEERELRELLLQAAGGERAADDPEVRRALEGDADAADWLATARAYDELGEGLEAEERDLVARALADAPDPADRALVRELLLARASTGTPARSLRGLLIGLAALLLVLVGASLWMLRTVERRLEGGDGEAPLHLGPEATRTLEALAPVGTVTDWDRFRWSAAGSLPPGGRYRVIVAVDGRELFRAEGLRGTEHAPTAAERAALAEVDTLRWTVEAYTADGERVAWGSGEAARRSR